MSSIYDKSSLVLIPSGTKAGKVYSQKPVSGDGDFTFTRSSAATRVNASGNIEKETSNLLLQSNTFDTTWTQSNNPIITSGQSGYDGTSDAWKIELTAAYGQILQSISISGLNCTSVYAKAGTIDFIRFRIDGSPNSIVDFNLTDGSTAYNLGNIYATSTSVGGGWYRLSMVSNISSSTLRIYPLVAANDLSGTSGYIYIQDAQVEQGLVARDYIETTTSAVYGGITDNVPRLDYTDSSCPALLLEPQRTNLITASEYFNSSYWIKGGSPVFSVSDNAGISPEGVSNATRFVAANAQQSTRLYTSVTWTAVPYTISLYVKNNGGTNTNLRFSYYDGSGQYFSPTFTLTDEWQRIEYTFTPTASSGGFWLVNTPTAGLNLDLLVFAAQLEAGSYATSYIPTYGSSVTRVADTGIINSATDLIGQTEGTLFVEVDLTKVPFENRRFFAIGDGTASNRIGIGQQSGKSLEAFVVNNGILQTIFSQSGTSEQVYKIAIAYKVNDFALYINGSKVGTDTSGSVPSVGNVYLGVSEILPTTTQISDGIKQALLFKTRLTNAELADLTTL